MSSVGYDQLRDQLLKLPPDIIQTLRAALELEPKYQQKLLDELPDQQPAGRRDVKVRRVKARDFSREIKWLRENAHLYPGEHLAVSGDELLAHGPDFGEVFDSAKATRSEEHTSELQSLRHLVCRLLLEKKKQNN